MLKDDLLWLLDDEDVRRKISAIASGSKISADNNLQNFRVENYRLQSELSKADQREKNLQSKIFQLQSSLDDAQNSCRRLESKNSQLKKSCDELQAQLDLQLGRGWQLFQDYQRLGWHPRQILQTGVFPHNSFMSFICGGAQASSLETIWDVVREAVLGGDNSDAQILWQIFQYAVELVNSAKAQASYEILPVQAGDRFDSDFHVEGPNSRAQGSIAQIYLPGFKNTYNNRIIRKSLVRVS